MTATRLRVHGAALDVRRKARPTEAAQARHLEGGDDVVRRASTGEADIQRQVASLCATGRGIPCLQRGGVPARRMCGASSPSETMSRCW